MRNIYLQFRSNSNGTVASRSTNSRVKVTDKLRTPSRTDFSSHEKKNRAIITTKNYLKSTKNKKYENIRKVCLKSHSKSRSVAGSTVTSPMHG